MTGGEIHNSSQAQALINDVPTIGALVAEKSSDSECIGKGYEGGNSTQTQLEEGNFSLNLGLYRYRHLVENTFA